jgi:hypothetical protein
MTTHTYHPEQPTVPARQTREAVLGGGTTAEALIGLAAVALAILGIVGVVPFYMTAIGVICAGAALYIEGVASTSASSTVTESTGEYTEQIEMSGGFAAQTLGGAAGIVLGVLALLGIAPSTLLPVAVLVMGSTLLVGGPARAHSNAAALEHSATASASARRIAAPALRSTTGILSLAGVGAVVLSILALTRAAPWGIVTLIGLLALGAAELLGGSATLSRMAVTRAH